MSIIDTLIAVLAPDDCMSCGIEGALLCSACMMRASPAVASRCYRCGIGSTSGRTCGACSKYTELRAVWACTDYSDLAKRLVHRLKFGRSQSAAGIVAQLMHASLPRTTKCVVVHVPTANSRVRARGYDQSLLMAKQLSRYRRVEHVTCLRRVGNTRQLGASRSVRKVQLVDALRPVRADAFRGKHVLLVDDVMTTGATLESAALCLRAAGAASVSAVVFARKV